MEERGPEDKEKLLTNILFKFSKIQKQGGDFRHRSAFLKDKHKWKNLESTLARRSRLWGTEEKPDHFKDDELPRSSEVQRLAKSQRSGSNYTASSGSNSVTYQEFMAEQYELERKAKMQVIEQESEDRMWLIQAQKNCGGHESSPNQHERDESD